MQRPTLIGIPTFGNFAFTKLAIEEIRRTVNVPYVLTVIVGQPGDVETSRYCGSQQIEFISHHANKGLASAINDLYDRAWVSYGNSPRNLIVMGNDVIPYPGAIDEMVRLADSTDWEWICSSQLDARSLVQTYAEARPYFEGANLCFRDFTARPWDLHLPAVAQARARVDVEPHCIKDVRNLCLFKRSVFEKIGYADANFWPGGYFEDNDYCRRANLTGNIRACGLPRSAYFHFWSRTIHQGDGAEANRRHFSLNSGFYQTKWGGPVNGETFARPFNGQPCSLKTPTTHVQLEPSLFIGSRSLERFILAHWKKVGAGN